MLVETHILQVIKKKMKKPLHEQRLSKHYMDSKALSSSSKILRTSFPIF